MSRYPGDSTVPFARNVAPPPAPPPRPTASTSTQVPLSQVPLSFLLHSILPVLGALTSQVLVFSPSHQIVGFPMAEATILSHVRNGQNISPS